MDPGVKEAIGKVYRKVQKQYETGQRHHDPGNDGIVPRRDGIQHKPADTGQREYLLCDHCPTYQHGHLQADYGLTYEKNPLYWGTTKINGKDYKIPFVDKLSWPIIVDEATRLAALRTGKCDINESVRVIYKKSLEDTNPDLARYRILSTSVLNIAMREDTKPFDDIRVRQALSMAIDRQGIINSLQLGEAETLSFPFAATWGPGLYTPLDQLPQDAQDLFKYDPAKAKKLMTDAGLSSGFQTEMVVSSSGTTQTDTAAMILSNWEANLNVKVTLKPADYATYLSIQYGKSFKGMYMMSKGNGDPGAVLLVIGPPADQYWNPSMWDDATYAETFQKAREAPDRETAYKYLSECNIRFIEQAPTIILPVGYYYAYAWPWVHNWYGEVNTNTRQPGLIHATIWIDRATRSKVTGQ